MKKSKDLVAGITIVLLAAFYLSQIHQIRVFSGAGATVINSGTIPMLWGGLLMLLGIVLLVQGVKKMRHSETDLIPARTEELRQPHARLAVPGTFCLLTFYVIMMGTAGFVLATIFYLFLQIMLLNDSGKRIWWASGALAVGTALAVYLFFVHVMHVPLPAGVLD